MKNFPFKAINPDTGKEQIFWYSRSMAAAIFVFAPNKEEVEEMKAHYRRGGLGDMKVKKYLNEVMQAELEPIRKRREEFAQDMDYVYKMLRDGSDKAREVAAQTLKEVREAIGLEYFK